MTARVTALDLAMANSGVATACAAWCHLGLPLDETVAIPTRAMAAAARISRRTMARHLSDASDAGLLVFSGYAGGGGNVARYGALSLTPAALEAAWSFLLDARRCKACRHLKVNQGWTCKRCRVGRRRDLGGVVAACAEARELRAAGRRISPTLLAAKHRCPLWTTESYSHGRMIPLQGLVRRLIREGLLTNEQAEYWRANERRAVGGASYE